MVAVQTSYTATIAPGAEGQIATEWPSSVDSKICDADHGIPFGRAVCDSSPAVERGVTLGHVGGSPAGAFVGISVKDVTLIAGDADTYQLGDNMSVMATGDIWVKAAQAVTRGHKASFDTTTGVLGTSGTSIPNSRWMTSAGAGQMAILRLTANPGT